MMTGVVEKSTTPVFCFVVLFYIASWATYFTLERLNQNTITCTLGGYFHILK